MEFIIQKAVELGAFQVIPVAMKRCVVKLDEKKADSKIKRWQGIAEAAAKQSKRGVIPTVAPVMNYAQAVKMASEMDLKLVPYELAEGMEQTKQLIESVKPGQRIAIFIGPEGGFDPEEIRTATEAGIQPIMLGKRILRTETAGFTTIAWLMYQLEN
jgi:16S rRNA (uracil1498-N3)-methyltransferase